MSAGAIDRVEQDATRIVRHQPNAHGAWQFFYRNARFRHSIGNFAKALYAIKIDTYSDADLQALEEIVRAVIKVIEVHVSRLGVDARDAVDRAYFRPILTQLETAAEGLEHGLAPDPSQRPSRAQLLDRFADMLTQQPLNLPDHTDRERAGTS